MIYLRNTIFKTLKEFIFLLDIHENWFIFIALLFISGIYKSKINLFILLFYSVHVGFIWPRLCTTVRFLLPAEL